jgi:PKD repeat protein
MLQNSLMVCGTVQNMMPNTNNTVTLILNTATGSQTYVSAVSANGYCFGPYIIPLDSNGTSTCTVNLNVNNCPGITQVCVVPANGTSLNITLQACNPSTTCSASIGIMPILGTTLSTLTATSTGTPPYTYSWSTGQTTQSINTSAQLPWYGVTVTDANGCVASDSIVMSTPPPCWATIQLPSSPSSNDLLAIGNGGIAPYTYSWSFNGTTIVNVVNSNILPALQAGTYCVSITDTLGCVASTCVNYTPSGSTTGCSSQFMAITDSLGTGAVYFFAYPQGVAPFTYSWTFSDGTTSNVANPVHAFMQGGFIVNWASLTVVDATGCVSGNSQSIVGNSNSSNCIAFFDSYSNYSPNAVGEIMFQDLSGVNISNVTYVWDFGDGSPISTSPNPTHTYAASGTYYVCLTITNPNGCVANYCQANYVDLSWWTSNPYSNNNCNAAFMLVSNPATPGFVNLIDISNVANGSYTWNVSNGTTANGTTPFFNLIGTGDFVVCLTVVDSVGNCTSTYCDTLSVDSLGDVTRSNAVPFNGNIGVNVIASAKPMLSTSINKLNAKALELTLMPNPANGFVNLISNSNTEEFATISIFDLSGKIVKNDSYNFRKGSNITKVDISDISEGIYLLKVISDSSTEILKLNIKH